VIALTPDTRPIVVSRSRSGLIFINAGWPLTAFIRRQSGHRRAHELDAHQHRPGACI
jgi:hypothetical protein